MPLLQIDLSNPADVQAGIRILMRTRRRGLNGMKGAHNEGQDPIVRAVGEMKRKKIWPFLTKVAHLDIVEYSLPELGEEIGMSSNKVCSLKAILAKPEQRLGIQFLEPAPSGTTDAAGNKRYQMPQSIKTAIQSA